MKKLLFTLLLAAATLPGWALSQENGVYLIGSAQDFTEFAALVNKDAWTSDHDAKVTADFTVVGNIMVGADGNPYRGTFDGQGHTITVNYINTTTGEAGECGLFKRVRNGQIKKLHVTGTITTSGKCAGGGVSGIWYTGTIDKCVSSVIIKDNTSGDGTHGGICARISSLTSVQIKNCAFIGSISAPTREGSGGILGWGDNGKTNNLSIADCLMDGTLNLKKERDNQVIARGCNEGCITNCYYTALQDMGTNGSPSSATKEELSDGTLCGSTKLKWHDNQYLCTNMGCLKTHFLRQVDGYYIIACGKQLEAFSSIINSSTDHLDSNAKLISDIDMSGFNSWFPIGRTDNDSDGNDGANAYKGTFDGQGHTIDNLVQSETNGYNNQGLFGVVNGGCTIKNLFLGSGCHFYGNKYVGAFVGSSRGSGYVTIENCGNEANVGSNEHKPSKHAAAFIGVVVNNGPATKIINCYNKGDIKGGSGSESAILTGWFGGHTSVEVKNFYNIGSVENPETDKPLYRNGGSSITFNNIYNNSEVQGATAIGENWLTNGELVKHLNMGGNTDVWVENDENTHPIPLITMTNKNDDGYFLISNEEELNLFAERVNRYCTHIKGKQTEDIDFSKYSKLGVMIGNTESSGFSGEYDGQGHTITLDYNTSEERTALFRYLKFYTHNGYVNNIPTIKNIVTEGTIKSSNKFLAGIVSKADGTYSNKDLVRIQNCVSEVTLDCSYNGDATIGGICATSNLGVTISNCAFTGKINATGATGNSGILGWAGNHSYENVIKISIEDCYVDADAFDVASGENRYIVRYGTGETFVPSNCYYVENTGANVTSNYGPSSSYAEKITKDDVISGKLCYLLNDDQSNIVWKQTLGTDDNPYPFSSSKEVKASKWFNDTNNDVYYNEENGNYTVYQLNLNEANTKYEVPANVTAKNVSMTRTLKAGVWNTFCSPVAIAKSNFSAAKELTDVTANGNNYSMTFTDVEGKVLEAGKPYMVQVSESKSSLTASDVAVAAAGTSTSSETFNGLTFTGNFTNGNAPLGSFIISNNVFYLVDTDTNTDGISEVALKAFRGYITTASNVKALTFDFDDDATGISLMEDGRSQMEDGAIYNLAGQRIQKMQKGINIVNGKKVMVK